VADLLLDYEKMWVEHSPIGIAGSQVDLWRACIAAGAADPVVHFEQSCREQRTSVALDFSTTDFDRWAARTRMRRGHCSKNRRA
jgi:hypothetical protein